MALKKERENFLHKWSDARTGLKMREAAAKVQGKKKTFRKPEILQESLSP